MNVQDLLYWIVVGILVGALILLVGNALLTSLIDVYVGAPG